MIFVQAAGFLLLALSQKYHYRNLMHRAPQSSGQTAFRFAGFAALAVSVGTGLQAEGMQFGPIWWLASANVVALLVLVLSAWRAEGEPNGR